MLLLLLLLWHLRRALLGHCPLRMRGAAAAATTGAQAPSAPSCRSAPPSWSRAASWRGTSHHHHQQQQLGLPPLDTSSKEQRKSHQAEGMEAAKQVWRQRTLVAVLVEAKRAAAL